jgi:hypothetical protein
MNMNIHLVCRNGAGLEKVKDAVVPHTYRAGIWVISDARAKELIGGKVFLHDNQSSPAYHAGNIVDVYSNGDDRKYIVYVVDISLKGTPAPRSGWSQEKCYVNVESK